MLSNLADKVIAALNGRFDHAYTIACKRQFDNSDRVELCDVGSALLAGSGDLTDAEQRVVQAFKNSGPITPSLELSLAGLLDRGNFTASQLRVIGQANRLIFRATEPGPAAPEDLELLRQIGEAAAVVEGHRGLHAQVQERLMLEEIKRRKVFSTLKSTDDQKAAIEGRCLAAEAEMSDASAALGRAQGALSDLQQARQRMRRDWHLRQHSTTPVQ